MNSIIYDDEIIAPEDYIWNYYYDFFNKLDKKDCVKFALFCAKYVNNSEENNDCIELVEKWLIDKNSINIEELRTAANDASATASYAAYYTVTYAAAYTAFNAVYAVYAANAANASVSFNGTVNAIYAASAAAASAAVNAVNINNINKYLQVLLRKTKQFQNNKILEQISKTDVDTLELVDWNMITDIMQEEYNIVHEFDYSDIFNRRCLIELLRKEYL